MKLSIRNKLIFAISVLMAVIFSFAAYLFVSEKKVEMADDIFHNALSFSKLTSLTLAQDYDLYLAQNGFVYFNRELNGLLEQNSDIGSVKLVSYGGEILYDSTQDVDKKYMGVKRTVNDERLLDQIHSENISLKALDGRIAFLKENNGIISYLDKEERSILPFEKGFLIDYLVVPANEKYSVVYAIDYANLTARVSDMRDRIVYLAIFALMLGIILASILSKQFTKPIGKLVNAAENIAKGNLKTRADVQSGDELEFLGTSFNEMAQDLEKSLDARIYQERVTHELQLATAIQKQIIPTEIPKMRGIDVSSGLIPAEEIGGDIYDFLMVDENKLRMYLGDVTGHGVPAGIVSSIASALFYSLNFEADLKKVIVEVNRVLHKKTMSNMFMTLCLMQWDDEEESFNYVSAGHEKIIYYDSASGKTSFCKAGGVALGMLPEIENYIEISQVDLKKDDFLVVYSDGIAEAWKNAKESYGFDRLISCISACGDLRSAAEIQSRILEDVKDFASGYKQMDDITIIVVKRK